MKFLALSLFLASFASHALIIEPGLWKIDMTLSQNGKEINPMEELKSALKDMPEDRKKQMMQAMEESGMDVGSDEMRQCYTKEMIEKAELGVHEDKDCTTKTVKKTPKLIVTNFECKDGSKGSAEIKIKNKKSYTGHMKMTDSQGQKSELDYSADFVTGDCGKVKPVGV